jgi:hypothetical protein
MQAARAAGSSLNDDHPKITIQVLCMICADYTDKFTLINQTAYINFLNLKHLGNFPDE